MKLLQAALLFSLLLCAGCQKIDENLLGGSCDNQADIEKQLEGYQ